MKPTAPLLLATLIPAAAHSIGLGEAALFSRLGEPLDVRIPVIGAQAEALSAECFSVAPAGPDRVPDTEGVALALERVGARYELRATTRTALREPYVAFALRASCAGGHAGVLEKRYVLLPEPPGASDLRPAEAPAASMTLASSLAAAPVAAPRRAAEARSPSFTLRLSTTTSSAWGKQRAAREAQRDIDADDRTAEMLQLRRAVELLDRQVAEMRLQLSRRPETVAVAAPVALPARVAPPATSSSESPATWPLLLAALLGVGAGFGAARLRRTDATGDSMDSRTPGDRMAGDADLPWRPAPTAAAARPSPAAWLPPSPALPPAWSAAASAGTRRVSPASTAMAR
jgi:hypothetical protein